MPLQLPNLDDRKYKDLVEEALSLIPTYAPEWTNHNPSDPGITLIELFAYLTEMLIYRLNRVTDDNIRSFLKLLDPDWQSSGSSPEALAGNVRKTVLALRKRERAVTCEDFEALALEADARVARARCVPRRNLLMDFEAERAGHISSIIVAQKDNEDDLSDIIESVKGYLEPRRLLTTHLHVVGPYYVKVAVKTTIALLPDERLPDEQGTDIADRLVQAVKKFFHPLEGGSDAKGWPFGRNVFVSEIYELLDRLPGVDYVASVDLTTNDPTRIIKSDDDELVGVEVKPYELVSAQITTADVTMQTT
jgi:hypothetical protein